MTKKKPCYSVAFLAGFFEAWVMDVEKYIRDRAMSDNAKEGERRTKCSNRQADLISIKKVQF